ncbi:MAG: T9SS type A sorting domain-containing protein [candidate division KSB1 bacterium]|nr:T9SS type A sorting domain-containing protein [candidate division KSB1 bacterium]MDZ7304615.1 T9SS type A sorting domain-containing protein [candidate division KSB1 bacterium]MDZ7313748.1 T9SS type A sorting domain-containing protein [candidate division KSB1 bacterium]
MSRLAFRFMLYVLIYVGVCSHQCVAQQLLWQRVFDTGKKDQSMDVATDSQGNIIVAGTTEFQSIQPPNFNDFLIVKYNPLGDTLWTRRFDADVHDWAHGVAIDNADNIIVVGGSYSSSTYAFTHVLKYNANGSILWARTFGSPNGPNTNIGSAVAVDSRCNIIVAGNRNSNWGDYITIKYDSSGTLIWMRTYDGGWEDCATDVAVDDSDNVVVTGYSNGDMDWDWCTIKYSPDGDTLWVRRHDVALDDKADGVVCDKDGNVIVVGRLGQSPTRYAAIVKYSPAGDTLWTKLFVRPVPLDGLMNFTDVATDGCGNIYTAGLYVLWGNGKDWSDYYIVKCNAQGDTLWTTPCDVNLLDEPSAINLDKEGNIIVTGTTTPNRYSDEYDYLTVKLHDATTGVSEENIAPRGFFLYPNYPNPFNPMTVISYQLPVRSFVSLKVYDLLGREIETLVADEKLASAYTTTWNATRFASGVYIARLTAGNFVASIKLVLIR